MLKTINKKVWQDHNDQRLERFSTSVVRYWQIKGLNRKKNFNQFSKEFLQAESWLVQNKIEENKIIKQTMHLLGELWSYFPHYLEVPCGDHPTAFQNFQDENIFKQVVLKRLQYGDNLSYNGILKALKIYNGAQTVSNFRPTSAALIYNYVSDLLGRNIKTWDMCAGWGGRLTGSYLTDKVDLYLGSEPASKTFQGLTELQEDLTLLKSKKSLLINSPCEILKLGKNFDLCFTSPPYYNREKYSTEHTQSYLLYPDYQKWLRFFLKRIILSCHRYLKDDGILALNIANIPDYHLEHDLFNITEECGFKWFETLQYQMSGNMFSKSKNTYKFEPVFLFKKDL